MLWDAFISDQQRPVHKWNHFFSVYEQWFRPFVNTSCLVVEIGVGRGGSLDLWRRYFGPHALVVGLDVRQEAADLAGGGIEIVVGGQESTEAIDELLERFGEPDIIIDDGSHVNEHQIRTFDALYPKLSKNGVYLVEDVHTSYWDEYFVSPGSESFVEYALQHVHQLNAATSRGRNEVTNFTDMTLAIAFYESLVLFKKGKRPNFSAPKRHDASMEPRI